LFKEAETYFITQEQERQQQLKKKDYSKINSRVNTNLLAAKNAAAANA